MSQATLRSAAPSRTLSAWMPWADRSGRLSWLRLAVFVFGCLPAAWMIWKWNAGLLSPKPITDILHESGDWAIRFIFITLAISPLRHAGRWNRIIAVRRMLGLFALFYTCVHLAFYVIDMKFMWVRIGLELVLRTYLTIGLFAVIVLVALGVTSNDAMVRRMGAERWRRLHLLVYAAALAGLVHYFMQVRLRAWEPSLLAGVCVLLAGYRLLRKWRGEFSPLYLLALALLSAAATALIEGLYYTFSMNAPFLVVLQANTDFSYEIRPAWYVLALSLALFAVYAARKIIARRG